jgi:hypothetical protein
MAAAAAETARSAACQPNNGLKRHAQHVWVIEQRVQSILVPLGLYSFGHHHRCHEPSGESSLPAVGAVGDHVGQQRRELELAADQRRDEVADRNHRFDIGLGERFRACCGEHQRPDDRVVVHQRDHRPGAGAPLPVARADTLGEPPVNPCIPDQNWVSLPRGDALQTAVLGDHVAHRGREDAACRHGDVGIVGAAEQVDCCTVRACHECARLFCDADHQRRWIHRSGQCSNQPIHCALPPPGNAALPASLFAGRGLSSSGARLGRTRVPSCPRGGLTTAKVTLIADDRHSRHPGGRGCSEVLTLDRGGSDAPDVRHWANRRLQ